MPGETQRCSVSGNLQVSGRLPAVVAGVLFLFWFTAGAAQGLQSPQVLEAVHCTGLQRLDPERVALTSGLAVGTSVDENDIRRAARRLLQTGYFSRVGYKFRTGEQGLAVEFQLEEFESVFPAMFDNFVGFDVSELEEALRRRLPLYDGTVPTSEEARRTLVSILSDLLRMKNIPGTVEVTAYVDVETGEDYALFRITGGAFPIAEITFPGCAEETARRVRQVSAELLGQPYSTTRVLDFARSALLEEFQKQGFLQVQFDTPRAEPLEDSPPGVARVRVEVPVVQGPQYRWGAIRWSGNRALSDAELTELLGIEPGEPADATQVKGRLNPVKERYWRDGYAELKVSYGFAYDESEGLADLLVTVEEGPQYRMGELRIETPYAGLADQIRRKWALPAGEVFDVNYPKDFLQEKGSEILAATARRLGVRSGAFTVDYRIQPDPENKVVHVVISVD